MAVQKRLARFGVAKQASKGDELTAATFDIGVMGGSVVGAELGEDDLDPTGTSRVVYGRERQTVVPMSDVEAIATNATLGLLLLGVTGAVVTTGTGPYTHVFTPSADVPYLTTFGRYGADYWRVADAKLDELELSFDGAGKVTMSAGLIGCNLTPLASAYTVNTEDGPGDGYMRGSGGTFTLNGVAAKVKAGSIKFTNGVEAVQLAASVLPDDVTVAKHGAEFSLTIVPDDTTEFRKVLTGSAAGTTVAEDIFEGAVDLTLNGGGGHSLQFASTSVALATEFPEADPAGGPVEITIAGVVTTPDAGDPYTVTLINGQATY